MTFLIILGVLFLLIGSFAESPSDSARRTRRLDPGGRDDFGGRF
ncbi:MAG TPA: hypothetical protein PLP50_13015 [Thermoanaerobaculia bacterium]|nr:hypothetical protein [Thermoanaerobaculia bacterium]HQN07803.1 hypothetical protein [Thermoanaerobaculia bacterium]HQP87731.1 hypothetical protein [Thermoanaerobaculia bacterium]